MYPKDDEEIDKARLRDKEQYGYYGYEGRHGYVSFAICMDMCKLNKQGESPGLIATKYSLGLQDTLTILITWSKYLRPGTDIYDIMTNGGQEYKEIQNLKDKKPLTREDIYEVLMDLEDFTKQKGDLK